MGDPGGIGPEVIVRALAVDEVRLSARFTIFGDEAILADTARLAGLAWPMPDVSVDAHPDDPAAPQHRTHNPASGALSFRWVQRAIDHAKLPPTDPRHLDAIVTGPISKEAWALAVHAYPGHTELFAERFNAHGVMMFYAPPSPTAPSLNAALVTTHIPLSQVPAALTRERILAVIIEAAKAMRTLGVPHPRIAVCGLNPHAGEHGLLGTEDRDVIAPAIADARAQGIDASGPWPADTVFIKALHAPGLTPTFDLVVAMYHDQGLAPVKLIARDRTVNITIGLPVVRTSPDHGTAFDIAGKGIADPGSMIAAIQLAVKMCTRD